MAYMTTGRPETKKTRTLEVHVSGGAGVSVYIDSKDSGYVVLGKASSFEVNPGGVVVLDAGNHFGITNTTLNGEPLKLDYYEFDGLYGSYPGFVMPNKNSVLCVTLYYWG